MDEQKWMNFIHHYWGTISFWQIVKAYRTNELPGAFFYLCALAARNELLMRISHCVTLCEQIVKHHDVGDEASQTLGEIKVLYKKGDEPDHSVLNLGDCGIKPIRDKVLAHPSNQIKSVLGKSRYQISLKWETVEATLGRIKVFADQVEEHNRQTGLWTISTYKDGVADVEMALRAVTVTIKDGEKYDHLRRQVMVKGKVTVTMDWAKHEIVIEN